MSTAALVSRYDVSIAALADLKLGQSGSFALPVVPAVNNASLSWLIVSFMLNGNEVAERIASGD